ncbi:MAG TPA: glycerol-3-phosphate dehydrogenase/oxidase [Gemmatimonadales bacterium]|nr:glycerol-3-phosphate dehydrogenase/oxidase [Gemmatimonadales bacterium]
MGADNSFSHRGRAAALAKMTEAPVDLLIIGGGITSAAIARDAALRGLSVGLIGKGDFAGGTSSHSSRLIHGGLRYLEHGDLRLVFEASRERRILLRIAPHLVRPLPFVFPAYKGARVPGWKIFAALWLYDLLASFRNVHPHRWLSRKAARRVEPGLREKGLTGAGWYWDAQADDARLTLATLRAATLAGANVANYVEVTGLSKPDGRVQGCVVQDQITGQTATIQGKVVVNATGPWVDGLRRLDDAHAAPLLRPTKGVHVVVPRARIGHTNAITLLSPVDGRVMFILPWGDVSYIGTTDTDDSGSPDEVRATGEDVIYLLRSANALFPQARLAPKDVISTWAGLRPLLAPEKSATPAQVSREHRVVESASGMLTIAGGKLTTHRVMGRDVVDRVAQKLHEADGRGIPARAATDHLVLPGGDIADLEVMVESARARDISDPVARHLVKAYGSESAGVVNLIERDRALGRPILDGQPAVWAEVVHSVEREMAMRLSDVLIRRTHLFYEDSGHGSAAAPPVARRMADLLGWDRTQETEEIADYLTEVQRAREFMTGVARASRVS